MLKNHNFNRFTNFSYIKYQIFKIRLYRYKKNLYNKIINYIFKHNKELKLQYQERDLKLFKKLGYDFKDVYPYDMFPFTQHIESIVLLKKKW